MRADRKDMIDNENALKNNTIFSKMWRKHQKDLSP